MKAKTLMGMIACAGACAVSVNVLAEDLSWFDGKVNTTTSALPTPQNAAWTAPTGAGAITYSTGKITLDNGSDDLLVLAPTASSEPTLSDGVVTITATALLTPTDASALETVSGARAGFAVGTENNVKAFYGFAAGLVGGDATGWVKLTGATPPSDDTTETSFKIVLDYRTGKKTVKFYVGTTLLQDTSSNSSFSIGNASALNNVAAYGSGSITALAASCEKAVAVYDGTKYGSIAEAKTAAGANAANVQGISPSGVVQNIGAKAANGMDYVVCEALGLSVTDPNADIAVAPAATDTAENAITLQLTTSTTGTEANLVGYKVTPADPEVVYEAGSIQIPLAAGTYTITPVLK